VLCCKWLISSHPVEKALSAFTEKALRKKFNTIDKEIKHPLAYLVQSKYLIPSSQAEGSVVGALCQYIKYPPASLIRAAVTTDSAR
jgi:hypothetical protein